jgi:LCP family protein required for cell wall assembly
MRVLKVDFLGGEAERQARQTTAWMAVVFAVVVGVFSAVGAGASYRAATHGTTVFDEVGNLPVIADIRRLAWGSTGSPTPETPDNRMTVLILGIGGAGHDGAQLTDTILLATADLNEKKVGVVSIPRDLAYPLGGGRFMKINAVNAYAEQDHPGQGAEQTAKTFSDLLSTRIDHVIRVDFHGFVAFIDALGGVDVTVENGFTDTQYPTEDDKWQTISFSKGAQHMDGARALIYARSRHGNNGEGSDFARSRRQQLVTLAVKDKLLSLGTLANPQRLLKLYQSVSNNVQTDLSPWDMMKLAPLVQDFSNDKVTMNVLTDAPDGELTPATVDGAYMLFPREQDWSQIRTIVQNPFSTKEDRVNANKPKTTVHLEIRNGTNVTGFAGDVADRLAKIGYQVGNVSNAAYRGYERTVIFDLTSGAKPQELARLKSMLDANVSATIPSWVGAAPSGSSATTGGRVIFGEGLSQEHIAATTTDFLIVLGDSTRGVVNRIGTQ